MIDCSPTDLHDDETLPGTLSACDPIEVDKKRTSGNVALMKSIESEIECSLLLWSTHFQHRNSLRLDPNSRPVRH